MRIDLRQLINKHVSDELQRRENLKRKIQRDVKTEFIKSLQDDTASVRMKATTRIIFCANCELVDLIPLVVVPRYENECPKCGSKKVDILTIGEWSQLKRATGYQEKVVQESGDLWDMARKFRRAEQEHLRIEKGYPKIVRKRRGLVEDEPLESGNTGLADVVNKRMKRWETYYNMVVAAKKSRRT